MRVLCHHRGSTRLELTLSTTGAPAAIITCEKGRFQLSELVMNEKYLAKLAEAGHQAGTFVPEMTWGAQDPGPPLIDTESREEFIAAFTKVATRYCRGAP